MEDMFRRLLAGSLMLVLTGAGLVAQAISFHHPRVAPPVAQTTTAHDHAAAHKCCHSSSGLRFAIAISPSPANMPCGNEHACCMRPSPASFAEVPSTSHLQRPDVDHREAIPISSHGSGSASEGTDVRGRSLLPYEMLNVILRI
jgi:hypothetical protein